jgi:hypothetical protein
VPDDRFDAAKILDALVRHDVDFVLIGGLAASILGSAYVTFDLDVAYERRRANLEHMVGALSELDATLRGAPRDVPFLLDAQTLERGLNFTFDTRFGAFDILGEPAGAPPYAKLRAAASRLEVFGSTIPVASIDHLIAMKEATGRPRDQVRASELRVLSDELRAPKGR